MPKGAGRPDDDVQASEIARHITDQFLRRRRLGKIASIAVHTDARDRRCRVVECILRTRRQRDLHPIGGQSPRCGTADIAAAAQHQRDASSAGISAHLKNRP